MKEESMDYDKLLEVLKEYEELRTEAYRDQAGIWTIGYGHTSMAGPPKVTPGMKITEKMADEILKKDVDNVWNEIRGLIKVPLTSSQKIAIISLVFNIGAPSFKKSTVLKRLNTGDYEGAAEALTWWNKVTINGKKVVSRGLVNRREKEKAMFLEPLATNEKDFGVDRPKPEAEELKSLAESKTNALSISGLATTGLTMAGQVPAKIGLIIVVVILVAVLVNRYLDRKKGIH